MQSYRQRVTDHVRAHGGHEQPQSAEASFPVRVDTDREAGSSGMLTLRLLGTTPPAAAVGGAGQGLGTRR